MQKKKEKSLTKKILYLLLLTFVIISVTMSRYKTSDKKTSTFGTPMWLFKIARNDIELTQDFEIVLENTITSVSQHVKTGVVAPNTSGNFIIQIDCRDCEVGVKYNYIITDLNIDIPEGIRFFTTQNYEPTSEVVLGTTYSKFISLSEISTIKEEIFYWKWFTEDDTTANISDTEASGSNFILNFEITGEQNLNQNIV